MRNLLIIGAGSAIGQKVVSLSKDQHKVYGTYHKNRPDLDISWQEFKAEESTTLDLPEKLDGVLYCPGRIDLRPFHRTSLQDFIEDYKVQCLGAISALQQCYSALKKGESPSVVLISTVAVQTGFPLHSLVSTSKGAIEGLTRALAAEWAPTIRVNAVAPSLTDTPLAKKLLSSDAKKEGNAKRHPLKRVGETDDIAQAAYYLLTEKSSWMTGQVLPVDGGISSLRV